MKVSSGTCEGIKFFADAVSEYPKRIIRQIRKLFMFVLPEKKRALYQSLRFNIDNSDANVNRILVRSLYGQFCSKENPEAENNEKYKGKSVENTFFKEVISTYNKLIFANNKDDIDLDIYSAICKSADIEYEKKQADETDNFSDRLDIDLETGEAFVDDTKHQRHVGAMKEMADRLFALGAPFLISDEEQPEDHNEHLMDMGEYDDEFDFTPIKTRKTFWGFNPVITEKCPELAMILGVNVMTQQNQAMLRMSWIVIIAVYGIKRLCGKVQ